ncbi:MAG: hypothetical protein RL154_1411 [Pseudomonadota bacterium]|jgi:predicted Fe-Mo cluster-binding NifX family protein
MNIAVPVWDDSLKVFKNAGHAPYFAVFSTQGTGIFKTLKLESLRANPRVKADHEEECSHDHEEEQYAHKCEHDSEAHKEEHRVMSEILKDCEKMVCHIACKNTKATMGEAGIEVIICKDALDAKALAMKAF